jgi:hypothetical protein
MPRLTTGLLALLLAGCSTAAPSPTAAPLATPGVAQTVAPSESALPSLGASPSAASSPAPSPPGVGTLDVFPPGSAVQVAVKELNLRRRPSTSAKRIEILNRGRILVISPSDGVSLGWGPVKANGYTWYPVIPIDVESPGGNLDPLPKYPIPLGAEPISGWVASDNGSRQYLTLVAPRCPTTVDLVNVEGMLPAERIACFGGPITLTGSYGCSGCGGVVFGTYKPDWLANPFEANFLSVDTSQRVGPVSLHFPPAGPAEPPVGSIITVTVHVDDRRSTRCTMSGGTAEGAPVPIDARTALLWCRERFVVDSYQVLGTDPSFPPG